MSICESARHTTNLYYSVIKFVAYRGFVWSGDRLPLALSSLGELYSVQVTLTAETGLRCRGAYWERGYLFATFEPGRLYNLDMRLEYHPPVLAATFPSDFASIHPKAFSSTLDFASAEGGSAHLQLGGEILDFDLDREVDRTLASGHRVRLYRERDYCSFSVSGHNPVPYGHRAFPILSVRA